jgi:hypothetical protein
MKIKNNWVKSRWERNEAKKIGYVFISIMNAKNIVIIKRK